MAINDWDTLPTVDKRPLLEQMSAVDLARRFGKTKEFFAQAKKFFASIPKQTGEPSREVHNPPKDLIVSARRNLSFFEANFELIDNSIDEWRRRGAKKDLMIEIEYDLDLLTGLFKDNAGGMDQNDVFRVFIPGETSNRDTQKHVIGSFGMGAKKGIFRLTDGARVVSSPDGKVSYTSEVPEKWEMEKSWETRDGRAEAINASETHLYFFKLVQPPTQADIEELRRRAGIVYAPLLSGELGQLAGEPKTNIEIKICGSKVVAGQDVVWASPAGGEPRTYEFNHRFANMMGGSEPIQLRFILRCGILTNQAAGDTESGFGIDAYGNGRLIERHLQDPFGFGKSGLAKSTPNTRFVRGKLFIIGHSGAVPWDTHKREYLADHPVSLWLREQLRPVIKAYADFAKNFTQTGTTEARHQLANKLFEPKEALPTVKVPVGKAVPVDQLPPKPKSVPKTSATPGETKPTSPPPPKVKEDEDEVDDGPAAEIVEDAEPENEVLTIELTPDEFSDLCSRFAVESAEELQALVLRCLTSGVAFPLDPKVLESALKKFKCDEGVGELSDKIRDQLIKKL